MLQKAGTSAAGSFHAPAAGGRPRQPSCPADLIVAWKGVGVLCQERPKRPTVRFRCNTNITERPLRAEHGYEEYHVGKNTLNRPDKAAMARILENNQSNMEGIILRLAWKQGLTREEIRQLSRRCCRGNGRGRHYRCNPDCRYRWHPPHRRRRG